MCIATTYGQLQIGAAILGEAGSDLSGYSISMNTAGNIVAIGAIHNDSNGTNAGHVRVYENNGGVWTQLGQEILGDGLYDQFGYAVSLSASGNILAVGAPKHDPTHSDTTFQGMVRVYEYVNGVWTQIGADLLGTTNTDEFGSGVSMNSSGTVLAIGAEGGEYVSIYENMAGTWTQIGVNISTVLGTSNKEVSINATGNRVAVRNAVGTGQVKIYENNAGTWTQLGAGIDGEATGDSFGAAVDLNAAGNIIAIGGPGNDGNGLNAGHVQVYQYSGGTWTQIGAEIQGVAFEDQFGGAVSINNEGTIIAAGAIETWNSENGYAQIYQNIAGTWTQIGNTIVGDKTLDRTGFFVSLSGMGDLVAVSAPYADDNGGQSGTTKVYRNENIVTQTGLIGTAILGEAAGDQSGMSVSSNATGDIIAIGAPRNDGEGLNNEGHVRVYQNTGGVWTQLGSDIDALGDYDQFGRSVSLNAAGTVVAIGAPIYDVTHSGNAIEGLVQVYEYIDGVWTQVGANIIGGVDDALGASVSLNAAGTIVAMSAPSNDQFVAVYENKEGVWTQIGANIEVSVYEEVPQAISLNATGDILAIGITGGNGKVQIYQNNAGTWTQVGADIVGEAIGDQFGASVSINAAGDIVAIGGFSNDGNGSDSGHVRIYQNVGGTWTQIGSDIDGEAAGDLFGVSVSINDTGDVVAIGSNLNDGNGGDSGHVRLYQNLSGIWTQLGSDMDGSNAGDKFGSSVALNATGNIVVIGAPLNDSNGTNAGQVQVVAFESHNTLQLQALLSGPYNTTTHLMDDGLRTSGVIPGASPYGDGAYVFDPEVFNVSGGNAIVDWVLIELRDKNNINTVLESKGALLQRDGDIVDVDGYSSLSFTRQNDNYFISISHRNHINIVTDTPQSLNQSINFRTASNVKGTTNAVTELTTGIYGLLAGEVNGDGQIQTTDYGLLNALIGQTGYRLEDINMDNQIQTTDITKLLATFGSGIQF